MIIYTGIILYILTSHFIGDFICQTDEMSKGKSTSIKWLTKHILAYGEVLLIMAILLLFILSLKGYSVPIFRVVGFILINMGLHWVTDYFTSKWTSDLWSKQKVHDFFVVIGLDQLIHSLCLIITFYVIFFYI